MSGSKIDEIYTLLKKTVKDVGIAENASYNELIALKGKSTTSLPMSSIKKKIVSKTYFNDIVLDHILENSSSIDALTSKRILDSVALIPICLNNSMAIRAILDFPNVFVSNDTVINPCIKDLDFLKKESPKVKSEFLLHLMVAVVEQLLKAGSLNISTKQLVEELKNRNASTTTKGVLCKELNNNPILEKIMLTFLTDKVDATDQATKPTALKKMFSQNVLCRELLSFRINIENTMPNGKRFVSFIETLTSFVNSQLNSIDRTSFMQLCNKIYINVKLMELRIGAADLSKDDFLFKIDGTPSTLTNDIVNFATYTIFEEEISPKTNSLKKPTTKCITQYKKVFNVFYNLINLPALVGLKVNDNVVERKFFGTVKCVTKISVKPEEIDFVNKLMSTLIKYFTTSRVESATPAFDLLKHLVKKCNLNQVFSAERTPILAKLLNPFEGLFAAIADDKVCSTESVEKCKTWFTPSIKTKKTKARGSADSVSNGTEIVRLEDLDDDDEDEDDLEDEEVVEDEEDEEDVDADDAEEADDAEDSESDMEENLSKTVKKTVKEPVKKTVKEPVEEPVKNKVKNAVKDAVKDAVKKPSKTPFEESDDESDEEPVKKSAKESVKKPAKNAVKKPVEESDEEPVEEPVKKPAKNVVKKPVKKPVEESVEESDEESVEESVKDSVKDSVKESVKDSVKKKVSSGSKKVVADLQSTTTIVRSYDESEE